MSDANTLSTFPFFRHVLRTGTAAERRWENTVAALLLLVSALPTLAVADAVAGDANHDANVPVAAATRWR